MVANLGKEAATQLRLEVAEAAAATIHFLLLNTAAAAKSAW
jgi:hypothetical protein